MDKAIDVFIKVMVPVLGVGQAFVPIVFLAIAGMIVARYAKSYWVEANANEWLLIISNGQLRQKGIGLATWTYPNQQVIKFPSLINQVNFTASQVSAEMQGIDVTGMLIWSVFREQDGPLNCFKYFGEDLQKPTPQIANGKIESMAVAIIRDRIANLTINDILKNRSKLRNGVKEEMQKILTGWGIWLETCEIQDVKISSRTLFGHLQTEFRESERLKAEKISGDTENTIKEEALVRDTDMSKKKAESDDKIRHEKLRRDAEYNSKKSQSENKIRYDTLEKTTQYDKKQTEMDTALKHEQLIRNAEYQKQKSESDITKRHEDLKRTTDYEKKQEELDLKTKTEALERQTALQNKQLESNNAVKEDTLKRDAEYEKIKTEHNNSQSIEDAKHKLEVEKQQTQIYKEELVIARQREIANNEKEKKDRQMEYALEQKKTELNTEQELYQLNLNLEKDQKKLKLNNDNSIHQLELDNKKDMTRLELEDEKERKRLELYFLQDAKKMELDNQVELYELTLAIEKEGENKKLKAAQFDSKKIIETNDLELAKQRLVQEMALEKSELKIKNDGYSPNVLKSMVIDTTQKIYNNINVKEMRVLNMGGKDGQGNHDPAAQLLDQMMTSYKSLSDKIVK